MPKFFRLHEIADITALSRAQVITLPIIAKDGSSRYRVRDITYSAVGPGEWPSHVEKQPELYVILQGSVIYDTGSEVFTVNAGEAIFFDIGDQHATRIEKGILSLGINLIRDDP